MNFAMSFSESQNKHARTKCAAKVDSASVRIEVRHTRLVSLSYRQARVITVSRKRGATTLEEQIASVLSMGYFLLGFRTRPSVDRSVIKVIKTSR
jgi:hypothetical protein